MHNQEAENQGLSLQTGLTSEAKRQRERRSKVYSKSLVGVKIDLTMSTCCKYDTEIDSRLVDRCPILSDKEDQVKGKGRLRYWIYFDIEGKGTRKHEKKYQ